MVKRMPKPPGAPNTNTEDRSSMRKEGRACAARNAVIKLTIGLLATLATLPVAAQTRTVDGTAERRTLIREPQRLPGRTIVLRVKDTVENTFVRPQVRILTAEERAAKAFTPATFDITYTGFSAQAQAAFQSAVDIWSQLVSSSVTIRVSAVWEPLDTGVLGSAGPNWWWRDFTNSVAGTWYPDPLADAMFGADINPGEPDIEASFNSDFSDWYLGTDGATPPGKWDLMSVALHELGHGLGFLGTMLVDDGVDTAECDGVDGNGCWGWGSGFPGINDRFTQDNSAVFLINTGVYANPSAALGAALTSTNVFFSGTNTNAGNGGTRAELYAPGAWDQGSSYAHLDEGAFPAGNPSSLMTPFIGSAEVIHDPGPVTLGIFEDSGWEVNAGLIFTDGFESGNTSAWSSAVP